MDYEDYTSGTTKTIAEESRMTYEIMFMIFFCLLGFCSDLVIIYTVLHFKRLHTIPNFYIVNWAIADACFLLVSPIGYRLISIILHNVAISLDLSCILFQMGATLRTTVLLCVLIVAVDCCFAVYFPRGFERLRKYYKFVLGSVWVFAAIIGSTCVSFCVTHYFRESLIIKMQFFSFCVLMLLVIVLQSSRGIQRCRKQPVDHPTLTSTLTTAFVVAWLLAYFILLFDGQIQFSHPLIDLINYCVLFSNSMLNLSLLYHYDKDFQACILQVLRRSENSCENRSSAFDNIVSNTNGEYSVAFRNPTNELSGNAY